MVVYVRQGESPGDYCLTSMKVCVWGVMHASTVRRCVCVCVCVCGGGGPHPKTTTASPLGRYSRTPRPLQPHP